MSKHIVPAKDETQTIVPGPGALNKLLSLSGRMPPVSIRIDPMEDPNVSNPRKPLYIDRFLSYKFDASVLVPVDTFEVAIAMPDELASFDTLVKGGDIITVFANGVPISVGIIDNVDIECDSQFGEKIAISGRNLLAQLEDQDSVSIDAKQVYSSNFTVSQAIQNLIINTRIPTAIVLQNTPKKPYFFATEPGEKKMQSLHRYLEPLNCLVFMNNSGQIVIGKPNFAGVSKGTLKLSKSERNSSNVSSMKVVRAATRIPNIVLPIWSGQESVQAAVGKQQAMYNSAQEPTRLRKAGHQVVRAVVISNPDANKPQEATDLIVSAQQTNRAGASNLLQAYGKREVARENVHEVVVEAHIAPGHYNESAEPFMIDTCYHITFDRGNVDEDMYLYQVQYTGDLNGQRTNLYFCRKNTIVSDVAAL